MDISFGKVLRWKRITEIIIISLILAGIALLPVGGGTVQQLNTGNIGLPEQAVQELRNLLKP